MSSRHPLQGLYVIVDPAVLPGIGIVEAVQEAAAGGARLFQYRDKQAAGMECYHQAIRLRDATAAVEAVLLINDRCDIAVAVEADGVHLGQDDLPLPEARGVMGDRKWIGMSTHTAAQVQEATAAGADYLGFGPVFDTTTKPDHERIVGTEGLRAVRPLTRLPLFAIGGITLDTVGEVVAAGADGVAVISAVWRAAGIAGTVRAFIERLEQAGRRAAG